jgi:hypothetical protein
MTIRRAMAPASSEWGRPVPGLADGQGVVATLDGAQGEQRAALSSSDAGKPRDVEGFVPTFATEEPET